MAVGLHWEAIIQAILPKKGSEESVLFCSQWDNSTPPQKLELCQKYGIAYQTGKNYRQLNRNLDFKPSYNVPPDSTWQARLDVVRQMDKLVDYHQHIPLEISIEIKTDKPFAVPFSADWQLGEPGCDYDSFEKFILTVCRTPNLKVYLGGDSHENIIQAQKMGSSLNETPIAVQKALTVQSINKLNDSAHLLALGTGNHNYWTTNVMGEDWDRELCRRLNIVYTKHGGIINLKVGDFVYPILRMHKGNFNSSFNLTHSCRQYQRTKFPQARVIVIEHLHVPEVLQYRYADNECVAIRTGTYGVYSDYAQQNGFFGAYVANPTVIFWPDRDKMVAFKDMYDAIDFMKVAK